VTGRVALVTGAARGIGAATVAALAAGGWRVVAVDLCADDPALPYALGSRADVASAADRPKLRDSAPRGRRVLVRFPAPRPSQTRKNAPPRPRGAKGGADQR